MYFVNFSNHSSDCWGEKQLYEAAKWGKVIDIPFPPVEPEASSQKIKEMAEDCVEKIMKYHPSAVMCQGEFTLSYHVVCLLKERGITVLSACSSRNAVEEKNEDGTSYKRSVFSFVQFREY